jgi:O-methyltransferase involved in polyketide biosynthesis
MVETLTSASRGVDYDLVSPTALLVAYLRALSGIPYCREIALHCDAEQVTREFMGGDFGMIEMFRAHVELRFKALSQAIEAQVPSHVLELASGVAPRGLIMSEDPKCTYVETDLCGMLHQKKLIVESMIELSERSNYLLKPLDATSADCFENISGLFNHNKLVVANEGLLMYLSLNRKTAVAQSIYRLLRLRGGVWLTPDISTEAEVSTMEAAAPGIKRILEKVRGITKCDFAKNCYRDNDDATAAFQSQGFTVERIRMVDVVSFSSLTSEVTSGAMRTMLEGLHIWKMKPI